MRFTSRVFAVFAVSIMFFITATAIEASEPIRVGVMKFESKTSGVSDHQAEVITDLFTTELAQSKRVQVFERLQLEAIGSEVKLGMSGLVDMNTAVEVGKLAGLQYMLMGSVTELSQKASGGAIMGIGGVTHEAYATIDMRVVEVATSRVVKAYKAEGTSKNTGSAISIGGFTYAEAGFGGIEARAIADAVSVLAHKLRSEMADESSHVIAASDNRYTIDVQSQPGSLYLVYTDGKAILDMSGQMIDREKIPFAVIKVVDTGTGHSVAALAEGCSGKLIRRGDKIEPIAAAKAKEMLSGKRFAKDRPSASSSTFEQIFGGGDGAATPTTPAPGAVEVPAATPAAPAPPAAATPSAPIARKAIDGFDPDTSSDAKVIETYPLSSGEINSLGILQRSSYNMYKNRRYKDAYDGFKRGFDSYGGHYLAAYWAGMTAQKLKNNDEAKEWFERALAINPNYVPASEAIEKIK